ncbi:aspartyl/asparaginyl beta-hydroxylase domain-containing protein [Herbiconiux daphne]|uniref:Aspartyl/asparaginyl beta-hydroxylase domain-containing protein n=1 Tax=Herbiconiux daphne TaxID=2970914 RepID=A0ABT2GZY9_9MICO|nr:aspartyl/asparaginyl beta-hydroxylase domain-containing protein [Herbiconiux daphne]MCS5732401.1 aspartyl/asparaginyl beta-hydroxylase domain-containing protein [Herbiconiux daphne]
MSYIRSNALEETGYVVLDRHDQAADPKEWLDLEYVDWKSSGDTRFAPLTSAFGDVECNGFWNHTPPRTDKDGVWVPSNVAKAPVLKARAEEPGANIGRCRVIELQPNDYAGALYNLHQDDNNRLNPDGTGWIVRGFFNLSDDADSVIILREDRFHPETEIRIPLPAGAQLIVDTQRFWHAVWHTGPEPRYCLITSWESGPELDAYIAKYHGKPQSQNPPLDPEIIENAQAEVRRRLAERAAIIAAKGRVDDDQFDEIDD